jgi:hypothetical protein
MRRVLAALLVDVLCVVVFVATGRSSHAEGLSVLGVLQTAGPFLAGLGLGWVVARAWRDRWPLRWRDGLLVWAAAVVGGMVLRDVLGQGTAPSFVVVAAVVLGVLLVGWRATAGALTRRGPAPDRGAERTRART